MPKPGVTPVRTPIIRLHGVPDLMKTPYRKPPQPPARVDGAQLIPPKNANGTPPTGRRVQARKSDRTNAYPQRTQPKVERRIPILRLNGRDLLSPPSPPPSPVPQVKNNLRVHRPQAPNRSHDEKHQNGKVKVTGGLRLTRPGKMWYPQCSHWTGSVRDIRNICYGEETSSDDETDEFKLDVVPPKLVSNCIEISPILSSRPLVQDDDPSEEI